MTDLQILPPTWAADYHANIDTAPPRVPRPLDDWHPDAPDYEPKPERVHPFIALASILGLALAGWLAFCWIVDLAMVVAR